MCGMPDSEPDDPIEHGVPSVVGVSDIGLQDDGRLRRLQAGNGIHRAHGCYAYDRLDRHAISGQKRSAAVPARDDEDPPQGPDPCAGSHGRAAVETASPLK